MAKKQDLKITRRKPETGRGGGSGKKETFPVSEESSVSPAETGIFAKTFHRSLSQFFQTAIPAVIPF